MLGLCPFHNEKTPSFTVSPNKQIFKCFGCGKGGNSIHFLMEHEKMTYPEAIRSLAGKYNIELEETQQDEGYHEEQKEREGMFLLNDLALEYFQQQLFDTNFGRSVALNYFKERGFREETIRTFALGYAPASGTGLVDYTFQAGYKKEVLEAAGLMHSSGRDFFRDRVMFAIRNMTGKVIGYGGRILKSDTKAPKYLNTPETKIYNKRHVLYGLFEAKKEIRTVNQCILVEGYTDVISLHQGGFKNTIAASGTSLTKEQIRLIKRFTSNVLVLFDGDVAGLKATMRALDMVLEEDLNVKIVALPEGQDPDSYLKELGASDFRAFMERTAKDFLYFKTDLLLAETQADPVRKAEVVKEIIQSIAHIPDPIKRALYIKECARLLELDEQILIRETNRKVSQFIRQKQNRIGNQVQQSSAPDPLPDGVAIQYQQPSFQHEQKALSDVHQEKDIVRLLITFGHEMYNETTTVGAFIFEEINPYSAQLNDTIFTKVITDYFKLLSDGTTPTPDFFVNHNDSQIREMSIDFLTESYDYSPNWEIKMDSPLQTQQPPEKNYALDTLYAVRRFKLVKIEKLCNENKNRLKDLTDDGESQHLLQVQNKLYEMRKQLSDLLNIVIFR